MESGAGRGWQRYGHRRDCGAQCFFAGASGGCEDFLAEHEASVQAIQEDVDKGAKLVVAAGIIAKEPIARKAIPLCNITYMDGEEVRRALSGYLKVLYDLEPSAVGGALPGEDFYYIP